MKIVQVITSLGAGGAEKILAVLAREFQEAGHSVSVISLQEPPENKRIPAMLEASQTPVKRIGMANINILPKIGPSVIFVS